VSDQTGAAFAGKRVLITGGLGFIGSHLAERLARAGADVLLIDSLVPTYGGSLFNISSFDHLVKVNLADVRDEYSVQHLVQGRDYLFNLAGQTSHMDSMADPFTDLDINCRAQLFILEACRKQNPAVKIVFASTRQIYGKPGYLPVDEKHPLSPVDINGINKLAGEWYHLLYNNVFGIQACALRLTNTYGPRMRVRDARQTFLGIWIRSVLEGKPFEVWDGEQYRDFTYVDDAVQAFLLAARCEQANGQVYNLGGDSPITLKALADLVVEVNGGGEYITRTFPEDRKKIDIGSYYGDWKRISSALGWQPVVGLREGLARTLAYYRENLEHYL
jgi:UDP-glucose 4-epimerase